MGGPYEIPDLLDSRGGSRRQLVVSDLVRLMPILAVWSGCNDGWLGPKLSSYFDAQQTVLDQAWRGFVRKTHPAIAERIKKETHRGNSGVFGGVAVRSYAIAGRVMFTFERDGETFSAVCDDSDMLGIRSGLNHCEAPFTVAYQMIVDATDNWDLSKFTKNDNINIC